MTKFGYFLSCEEFSPKELVWQARMAEQAGFEALWISDHYHPWMSEQGQSAFVWSVIGALSEATSLPVTTAVTCPIMRIHPAIVAQAAATSQVMLEGRFRLGLGTGEALNEHVVGSDWPPASVRMGMLEEAIEIIRKLFTGEQVTHRGVHFRVDTAQLYTLPDRPPPILMSAFGPKAARVAGRIADGYMTVMPDREVFDVFAESGGAGKLTQAGTKVCWGLDHAEAVKTAQRTWANEHLGGEAGQLLPLPRHFEQLAPLVTEETVDQNVPCGPDLDRHVRGLQPYVEAGFDEVYINQIGPEQEGFFSFYADQVLPRLRAI